MHITCRREYNRVSDISSRPRENVSSAPEAKAEAPVPVRPTQKRGQCTVRVTTARIGKEPAVLVEHEGDVVLVLSEDASPALVACLRALFEKVDVKIADG